MNRYEKFSTRSPGILGGEHFRQYSVLIPLIPVSGRISLLFEKRSGNLRHQPGEICFPGGKQEHDESYEQCAIRETKEELLVSSEQVEVFGPGDIYISPFNQMLHSFVGTLHNYQNTFNTDEVQKVITIPLDFFRDQKPEIYDSSIINRPPENFPYDSIPGGRQYPWKKGTHEVLFYRYEETVLWGMTAQIAKSAVDLIDTYHLL